MSIHWQPVPTDWRATPIARAMAAPQAPVFAPVAVKVETMSPAEYVRTRAFVVLPGAKKMKTEPGTGPAASHVYDLDDDVQVRVASTSASSGGSTCLDSSDLAAVDLGGAPVGGQDARGDAFVDGPGGEAGAMTAKERAIKFSSMIRSVNCPGYVKEEWERLKLLKQKDTTRQTFVDDVLKAVSRG